MTKTGVMENILAGMYQAIGFVIITTIFSILSWFALKRFIIKQGAELWVRIKEQGLKFDAKMEIDKNGLKGKGKTR